VRAAHKSELDNLERGHTLWDVSINQDGENAAAGSARPNGSHGQAPANGTGDEIPRAASPDVSGSTGGKGASQETPPASAAGAHAGSAGGAGLTGGGTVGGRGGSGTGEPPRAGAGSGGGDEDNRGHGPNEDPYAHLRNMSLEERLDATGRRTLMPIGEEVGRCDFHDYREASRNPDYTGVNTMRELRHELMDMGFDGQNAAMVQGELFSNYFDHADDEDSRYFVVSRSEETGDLEIDYYCFAPVKDETFSGFEFYLDPRNYDVEETLREGRARDPDAPTAAYGVPEDTGRGLALIVTHTLNDGRRIERMGQGAHIKLVVNPNDITPTEIRRILDEASGIDSGAAEPAELTEQELLDQYGEDDS
jgi:hypothetical protein